MQTVEVALSDRRYPIYIGEHLLERSDVIARPSAAKTRRADHQHDRGARCIWTWRRRRWTAAGVTVTQSCFPTANSTRTGKRSTRYFDALLAHRCERGRR